jgi:hypothetical protein
MKKLLLPLLAAVIPSLAFAQAGLPPPPVSAPSTIDNINQILSSANVCTIVNWVFWFIIILAIIFTLVAAFRYLTAAGDPEKVKRAGATLLYVVVAVVVALIAKGFPLVISSFIGGGLTNIGC